MEVGREFASYAELETVIADYQDKNFVRLYKRDTRRIEAAKRRVVKKDYNPQIVYSGIKYTCVHGGKMFVSHNSGMRPNAKTMKLECPFMIRIASSVDGQRLVVKEMITEHNHEVNEGLYQGYRIPTVRIKRPDQGEMVLGDPNSDSESDAGGSGSPSDSSPDTKLVLENSSLSEVSTSMNLDVGSSVTSESQPPKKFKIIFKRPKNQGTDRWVGRVAVVTGASSGIGASVARALVSLGMHVVGCARTVEPIQTMAKELAKEKGNLTAVRCDVTREEDVKAVFKRIRTDPKLATVHAVVACAGIAHEAPLLSGATSQWRDMLDVNVLGVLVSIREAVQLMEETAVDDGHIFLINSMSGHKLVPKTNSHFYAATKFMVTALTEGIRNELREKKTHTRVTAISPGTVETDFMNRMFKDPSRAEQFLSKSQFLKDKDVADTIVYALTAPPHVQVHDVLMTSTEQS